MINCFKIFTGNVCVCLLKKSIKTNKTKDIDMTKKYRYIIYFIFDRFIYFKHYSFNILAVKLANLLWQIYC